MNELLSPKDTSLSVTEVPCSRNSSSHDQNLKAHHTHPIPTHIPIQNSKNPTASCDKFTHASMLPVSHAGTIFRTGGCSTLRMKSLRAAVSHVTMPAASSVGFRKDGRAQVSHVWLCPLLQCVVTRGSESERHKRVNGVGEKHHERKSEQAPGSNSECTYSTAVSLTLTRIAAHVPALQQSSTFASETLRASKVHASETKRCRSEWCTHAQTFNLCVMAV